MTLCLPDLCLRLEVVEAYAAAGEHISVLAAAELQLFEFLFQSLDHEFIVLICSVSQPEGVLHLIDYDNVLSSYFYSSAAATEKGLATTSSDDKTCYCKG